MPDLLEDLTARIAKRDASRAEATLQADIRQFILSADLNIDANDISEEAQTVSMESQLGDGSRRRIDVETGTTVIEVKRNLRIGSVLADGEKQLGQYVATDTRDAVFRRAGVGAVGRRACFDQAAVGNTDAKRLVVELEHGTCLRADARQIEDHVAARQCVVGSAEVVL